MKNVFAALALLLGVGLPAFGAQAPLTLGAHPTGADLITFYNASNAAISSMQSGASDPGALGAYTWWADTGNVLLKQRNATNTAWVTISPLGSQLLPLTGGTLSGTLQAPQLEVSGAAGTARALRFKTASTNRWAIAADNTAESGSNAGSNLHITSYTDAGAPLTDTLVVTRATGVYTLAATPVFPTAATSDNSTKGATTAWARNYAYSGTYTPTVSNTSGVFAYASYATYTRVGNIVTVRVTLSSQPTSSPTPISLQISLPAAAASNIASASEIGGTGYSSNGLVVDPALVTGVVANPGRVNVQWISSGTLLGHTNVTFSYEVH